MATLELSGGTGMSQSNKEYRLFFKKLTDLSGKSLASSDFRVLDFTINRDLLTKATSKFEVLNIPTAIENGDIVEMYDSFGTILYIGIVTMIEDNTIQAEQSYGLFEDNWLWNNPRRATIEDTLKTILTNDFQNNRDTLMASIFGAFDIQTTSNTNLTLQTQEDRYVVDFSAFLYDIYEKYSIILDIEIPYSEGTPTIKIGSPSYDKLKIGNNAFIFRNFDITKEVFETNKLIVYGEENGEYRGEWFTTPTGITDNPSALNRIPKINTNIVFSDDDINIIKASSLRNEIYNHHIELELVYDNKLLPFEKLKLGQGADIYFNGNYYDTVLTGYQYGLNNDGGDELIKLVFGLVRTSLTSKLFKRLSR